MLDNSWSVSAGPRGYYPTDQDVRKREVNLGELVPLGDDSLQSKTIPLQFASSANVQPAVQQLLSAAGKVLADSRNNQLTIVGTEKEIESAKDLVSILDAPTKQVLIETQLS